MNSQEITPADLLRAYAAGLFPMAESRSDPTLHWFDPSLRGVMPLDGFNMSRSLARTLRRGRFRATLNVDFDGVMEGCAARDETWINGTIHDLYSGLHDMGHAHSLEVWQDDTLAGGVYGVTLGTAFFGESMFSARRDASKVALAWLVDHLARCGFTLFDTQFTTPHLISLGAVDMPRDAYRERLAKALEAESDIQALPIEGDPQAVVQRITQTSYRG